MLMDKNLQFSNAQAITATAASTNTYDMETGLLVTTTFTPSPNAIIGNATYFGMDLGLGRGMGTPTVIVKQVNANNAATGTSLQIAFQGAPMNSTAFGSGNVSDLTFTPYVQTAAIGVALLLANTQIAAFDWPVRQIGSALPRFVNLNYTVGGSNFTNLTLDADVSTGADTAQGSLGQYPANY
jgi:hypothetical protein